MAFRLVATVAGRESRFPLGEGEHVVGSAEECGVRLHHPSVSRRHALLRVGPSGVTLADLDSRNGSRVDGARVTDEVYLPPGTRLLLGSVPALLEEVSDDDAVVGIPLGVPAPRTAVGEQATPAGSTVAPTVLEAFVAEHLPDLAHRLATCDDSVAAVQAAGEVLFRALPCRRVEVVRSGAAGEGILFLAERGGPPTLDPVRVEERCDDLNLVVSFAHDGLARAFTPITASVASLLALARRLPGFGAVSRPDPPSPPPPLPEPPTVVEGAGALPPGGTGRGELDQRSHPG